MPKDDITYTLSEQLPPPRLQEKQYLTANLIDKSCKMVKNIDVLTFRVKKYNKLAENKELYKKIIEYIEELMKFRKKKPKNVDTETQYFFSEEVEKLLQNAKTLNFAVFIFTLNTPCFYYAFCAFVVAKLHLTSDVPHMVAYRYHYTNSAASINVLTYAGIPVFQIIGKAFYWVNRNQLLGSSGIMRTRPFSLAHFSNRFFTSCNEKWVGGGRAELSIKKKEWGIMWWLKCTCKNERKCKRCKDLEKFESPIGGQALCNLELLICWHFNLLLSICAYRIKQVVSCCAVGYVHALFHGMIIFCLKFKSYIMCLVISNFLFSLVLQFL
mgnify:CR=1 FL=1